MRYFCYLSSGITAASVQINIILFVIQRVVMIHGAFAPLMEDIVFLRPEVPGRPKPGARSWADSYSYNNSCYCSTTFDHGLATVIVTTPLGNLTVLEVCTLLNRSAPILADVGPRPLYNDIQCGNGPSVISDEVDCPGRTEYGQEGCKYIGPKWDFTPFRKIPIKSPVVAKPTMTGPTRAPTISSPVLGNQNSSPILVPVRSVPPTKSPIKIQVPSPIGPPSDATESTKAPTRTTTPTNRPTAAGIRTNTMSPSQKPILSTTDSSTNYNGLFRRLLQHFVRMFRALKLWS